LAKDKAAALLMAQEEVRNREEELEDADAELIALNAISTSLGLELLRLGRNWHWPSNRPQNERVSKRVRGKGQTKGT
jgi:hypothetical protein